MRYILFFFFYFFFFFFFFFFNDTATTEIYTLSLHRRSSDLRELFARHGSVDSVKVITDRETGRPRRSEEHTSELQSRGHLVCRLLLEKKKNCPEQHGTRRCNKII